MRSFLVFTAAGLLLLATAACGSNPAGPSGPSPLTISPPSLEPAVMGSNYIQSVNATGGTSPYTWSVTGSLPSGLNFSNGMLTGTPMVVGDYQFGVSVTDQKGQRTDRSYGLRVLQVPCVNEDINVPGVAHVKVIAKPCGQILKVGTPPTALRMEVEETQYVLDRGWFYAYVTQDPIGTPDKQIGRLEADIGADTPWIYIGSKDSGIARGETQTVSFVSRGLLNQNIPAGEAGTLTYMLITLTPAYSPTFSWVSSRGCNPAQTDECAVWQTKILLNDLVVQ